MLNIFLNGDMVRCPDISAILLRKAEQNLLNGRCKYGFHELKCPAWFEYCRTKDEIKPISAFGRCHLSGCDNCPMHKERVMNGLKTKNFKIDNTVYRKISSSSHYLLKTSKHKTLFFTLTFPNFKKYVTLKEINRYFSTFVRQLRDYYGCQGYIGVREFGTKNNRVHFHLLISLPYIDFRRLNDIWCNIIADCCDYSKNALQTDAKTRFIENPTRAMRYVCKYFAKAKGQASESRLVFISNNLLSKVEFTGFYDTETGEALNKRVSTIKKQFPICNISYQELLNRYQSVKISQTSDYTTAFRITDKLEFERFCNEYLYILFDLPAKNHQLLTD